MILLTLLWRPLRSSYFPSGPQTWRGSPAHQITPPHHPDSLLILSVQVLNPVVPECGSRAGHGQICELIKTASSDSLISVSSSPHWHHALGPLSAWWWHTPPTWTKIYNFHQPIWACLSYGWRRRWHPTPVLLPGKSHGRRSLVGCRPWGREESNTTERLHFHFSLSCFEEGNGNPLQCSCLENPRDGGAWWAAVYGVAQSWTRLKRLSSSSSSS